MPENSPITIQEDDAGQRLDVWCVAHFPGFSRAELQRGIKEGAITVNGKQVKPRYPVREGDSVACALSPAAAASTEEAIPLELPILFEDENVVVINKPAGVTAHAGVNSGTTISDWFREHYPDAQHVGEDDDRAGIVHRLDKDTSGVMVLAKTERAHEHLKKQFAKRYAKKTYLALVYGTPKDTDGRIVQAIARSKRNPMRRAVDSEGKQAITEWERAQLLFDEQERRHYTLLKVFPHTGRTHQIRVHLHWLGFPIVGDQLYTFKRQKPPKGTHRQLLHAYQLAIRLPDGSDHVFEAAAPEDLERVTEPMIVADDEG